MKNYLFAALLLGSFIAFISTQSESFDFVDSQGRCWRCTSGSCAACPASILPQPQPKPVPIPTRNPNIIPLLFPNPWDRNCTGPTDQDCITYPTAKFPSNDINWFWDCAIQNGNVPQRCDCDKGFDMTQQRCVYSNEMRSIGCAEYANGNIIDCTPTTQAPPPTDAPTTVSPTTTNPCLCIPFWPCRCNPCWLMPCRSCNGCMG